MEIDGKVSICVGKFSDQESVNKYINLTYDNDGEIIASQFYIDNNIDIDDIDEYLMVS